eukprot:scaffold218004_cov18-Tisochrysis_lutea.AAC.1
MACTHESSVFLGVCVHHNLAPCILLRAVPAPREAGGEEDDDGQDEQAEKDQQLPLAVIPPHLVAQGLAFLPKQVGLLGLEEGAGQRQHRYVMGTRASKSHSPDPTQPGAS